MTNKINSKNAHWSKSEYHKNVDEHLGNFLREYRKKLGYSRKIFIEKLDKFYNNEQFISFEHYSRIERGERSISANKLILLIQFFNYSIRIYNNANTTKIKEITIESLYNIYKF